MSRLVVGFVENIAPDDAKVLTDGLLAHAEQAGFSERPNNLAILVRDDTGVIRAGLMGNTSHRECYIIPHSPDEHMSCQGARIDSDIGISSLCRWIEGSYGAPSG